MIEKRSEGDGSHMLRSSILGNEKTESYINPTSKKSRGGRNQDKYG